MLWRELTLLALDSDRRASSEHLKRLVVVCLDPWLQAPGSQRSPGHGFRLAQSKPADSGKVAHPMHQRATLLLD